MKKIFSILTFAFLFATEGLCQAQVDIPLSATDSASYYPLELAI